MTRLRVGIVGAGIAKLHLTGFRWAERFYEVRALCHAGGPRGPKLAAEYGIADVTTEFDALVARDDLDVIDVCTPPHLHAPMVEAALRAGKHVICEKPLFGSVAECDRMAALAKAEGRHLMPIFQYRWGTGLQKLKLLVEAGLAGEAMMTTAETHWRRGPDYYDVAWRGRRATELGGCLLAHAIHAHDMVSYVHGPWAKVFALALTRVNPVETEDTAALSARMRNGSLAALSVTLGSPEELSRVRFCFRDLTAESIRAPYHLQRDPWTFVARDAAHQRRVDDALAGYVAREDGYTRQFELFAEAVRDGTAPPVTVADARLSLAFATAAYASARSGRSEAVAVGPGHPLYEGWDAPA